MLFNRRIATIICLLLIVGVTNCLANKPTHSKEETERFSKYVGRFAAQTEEDHWYVISGLEKLLENYPHTYLKSNIMLMLLTHYSHVTKDADLLTDLAEKTVVLSGDNSGAYQAAARILVNCDVRSEKTLQYAQKALTEAREKQKKWDDYDTAVLREQTLLARAYQLAGKHQEAVDEIQRVIKGWKEIEKPGLTLATRQSFIDRARGYWLTFYIEEKAWDKAYELASELLKTSIHRDEALKLWNEAYVGRFGSAKGMGDAYSKLNAEWEKEITRRMAGERISKPAPNFSVETLEGEMLQLVDLKGKPVVVTFWAGWCSPCIEELPLLSQLKARFQGVEFLAINIDKDSNTRRDMVINNRFQRGRGLTFVLGNEETREAFGTKEIPYTCVIDGEGNIRYERKGMGADFRAAMASQLEWIVSLNK